ncbi:hypothetical protein [Flexivirga alba]|uniref:Uncharacterized protein n=1 Tax=Flexivirga alba TaxID=702742 RepID=A0ABW2AEW5_9MICO
MRYLQDHLGTYRFYTLGPIEANYGSYWRISQFNANDLPVPKKYARLVETGVRPTYWKALPPAVRGQFVGYRLIIYNTPASEQRILLKAYGERQQTFRDASVRYVVTRRGVGAAGLGQRFGLRLVYQNERVEIWRDARAVPYFTTSPAGACSTLRQSLTDVTVRCQEPATLVRRQLSTPGWRADVNGHERRVVYSPTQLYQRVTLPAGTSTVSYSYHPAHFRPAVAVSLAVVLLMLLDVGTLLVIRRRPPEPNP